MSFDNRRFERMQKIIELLRENPQGLKLKVIAKDTKVLMQIKRKTLLEYLDDLVWSNQVVYMRSEDRYKLRK